MSRHKFKETDDQLAEIFKKLAMEGDEVIDYDGNCLLLLCQGMNGVVNYPACYLKSLKNKFFTVS